MTTPFRMIWFTNYACRNWDLLDNKTGYHWLNPHMYTEMAQLLEERGRFDAIVLADISAIPTDYQGTTDIYVKKGVEAAAMGDLVPLFSAMTARTQNIGMIGTLSTTLYSPELLAQTIGSLDFLTSGRAGWNIVTSLGNDMARNYGMDEMPSAAVRYDQADEFVDEVNDMWRTAKLNDGADGLQLPPSPQGSPVIMQAGGSERGREFAAKHAEIIIAHRNTVPSMKAFRDDMRERMARIGRDPDSCKVFFTIKPVIADTHEEAEAMLAQNRARPTGDVETGLAYFSSRIGYDLSTLSLDEPLPSDLVVHGSQGTLQQHLEGGKGPTLRDVALAEAIKDSFLVLGTPEEAADQMAAAMEEIGGDGFAVRETLNPSNVVNFVDKLVPVLQSRGLTRTEYHHDTLRDNLLDPTWTRTSGDAK